MIKYTTPTMNIKIPSDLEFDYLIFSLEGLSERVDKTIQSSEVVDGRFSVTLTQEETGQFSPTETVKTQINFIQGDKRYASCIRYVKFGLNIIDGVVA